MLPGNAPRTYFLVQRLLYDRPQFVRFHRQVPGNPLQLVRETLPLFWRELWLYIAYVGCLRAMSWDARESSLGCPPACRREQCSLRAGHQAVGRDRRRK